MLTPSRACLALGALLLSACGTPDEPFTWAGPDDDDDVIADDDDSQAPSDPDEDNDGYPASVDCDDEDPHTWPGAPELCDELDNDCDGSVDEEPIADLNWYQDLDGDGYGNDEVTILDCSAPEGYSIYPGDCNDDNPTIHPGALVDGYDADCDGRREWRVEITITVVQAYQLCIDGAENIVGSDSDWEHAETHVVWMDGGEHVVGFHGIGSDGEAGDDLSGAIAVIALSNGTEWWTNSNWRSDPHPEDDDASREGWCAPGFDITGWGVALDQGVWGVPPWGDRPPELAGTPASWIWDSAPVDHKNQYFRLPILLP
ncbi:MAG: putative metal-binding motif-containing protein [Myxococcota bacterium]|nr:putative metal-binding motif-containing protein [Myxococcota bacterium]